MNNNIKQALIIQDNNILKEVLITYKENELIFTSKLYKDKFTSEVRSCYETLHKDLMYTDFDDALNTFSKLNQIFIEINYYNIHR